MTNKNPISAREFSMQYGVILGLYWIVSFSLFPLGLEIPFLEMLFLLLTLASPIVVYFCARHFRDTHWEGSFNFVLALKFCISTYFHGALLAAVGHFVYLQFIDRGRLYNYYTKAAEELSQTPGMEDLANTVNQGMTLFSEMRPIEVTMQLLMQNVFYGILFSLLIAAIVKRKGVENHETQENKE